MTEEERGQWRQYKANVVRQLQAGRDTYNTKYHNALVDTDKRIGDSMRQYVSAVYVAGHVISLLPCKLTSLQASMALPGQTVAV